MALQKSQTLPNGVTGNYWRIIQLCNHFDRSDGVVDLALYLDANTRQNAIPLMSVQVSIPALFSCHVLEGDATLKNITLESAYVELKAAAVLEVVKEPDQQDANLAFFADAVDA